MLYYLNLKAAGAVIGKSIGAGWHKGVEIP